MWCISRPVRNTGTAPRRIRRYPTSPSRRLAVRAAGNRTGRVGDPRPLTRRYTPRLEDEGGQTLAAVPAHALKQAAQIRDLTTVCHVVPGHLSQGSSHGARLGYRGDDTPHFQVSIAQGGQVG